MGYQPEPVTYTAPSSSSHDLLAGLPVSSSVPSNTPGWTRSPTTDILTDPTINYFTVKTNCTVYNKYLSPDINVYVGSNGGSGNLVSAFITRSLPNVYAPSWSLNSIFQLSYALVNSGAYIGIEIADASGNLIIQLSFGISTVTINGVVFLSPGSSQALINIIKVPQSFIVKNISGGGGLNVTYASITNHVTSSNPSANVNAPASLSFRINYAIGNFGYPYSFNFSQILLQ